MEWFSLNIRLFSSKLYPFRKILLVAWVSIFILGSLLNLTKYQLSDELGFVMFMWPFYLWLVTFVWGHPDVNKYKKVQLLMLPFALGAVIGLFVLVPITILVMF